MHTYMEVTPIELSGANMYSLMMLIVLSCS